MSEAVVVEMNPFRSTQVAAAAATDVMSSMASSREIAEVQTSMMVARRFPRSEVEAVDKILQACTRTTLAEGALYEYSKGGSDIRGPSIRLAECIAQYWGHLDFGWRTLEEHPGLSKVQAFCWDMQTGVRSQMTFDVAHEIVARGSKKQLHDPREIYEHVANNASRRLRACILRVIPGDVVEAAQKQCEKTLQLKVEVTPERLQSLVTQFAAYGVTKAHLEKRIQRRLEAMTPGMMVQLGKIWTSLHDGLSGPEDWFDIGGATAPVEPSPAPTGGSGGAQAQPPTPSPRQAVRERLQAAKRARGAEVQEVVTAPPMPGKSASQPLQDIIRFSRAAVTGEDVDRIRQIALELSDEDEVLMAQEHINAAAERVER